LVNDYGGVGIVAVLLGVNFGVPAYDNGKLGFALTKLKPLRRLCKVEFVAVEFLSFRKRSCPHALRQVTVFQTNPTILRCFQTQNLSFP
jgi:hypothetical protein